MLFRPCHLPAQNLPMPPIVCRVNPNSRHGLRPCVVCLPADPPASFYLPSPEWLVTPAFVLALYLGHPTPACLCTHIPSLHSDFHSAAIPDHPN